MSQGTDPPLRILSLDGGGIRGKSSLLILESIMERIRESEKLGETHRPCDIFDLIGGTSTGGIIAIMLGRLRMSVDECIRAYDKVGEAAFTPKSRWPKMAPPKGAFSAIALEAAIKEVVKTNCVESSCTEERNLGKSTVQSCPHSDMQFRDSNCTKNVVLAMTKDNVNAPPTLLTTYDTTAPFKGCTIWQVARATSAATTFFKSIQLGRDKVNFIDAGFGHNNPCQVLIGEAQRQFPDRKHMQVLSIGTGLGNVVPIKDDRWSIIKALKKMATESKKVATELDDRYGESGTYYRFDVERGLEDVTLSDWEKTSQISAHTSNYLRENRRALDAFVRSFTKKPTPQEAQNVERDGQSRRLTHYYLPLYENEHFVKRSKISDALAKKLFQESRREVALVGLGGAGKSQIALQLAYDIQRHEPEYSIFWISALSTESFDRSCAAIAEELGIQDAKRDSKELLHQYLQTDTAGKCIIIIDNADDGKILYGTADNTGGLYKYVADPKDGQILFTTRSGDVAREDYQRGVIEIPKMEFDEAIMLMKELSVPETLLQSRKQTMELLKELTYLPLAIAQASAYLRRNGISISKYLTLLRSEEKVMVDLMSRAFNDNNLYEKAQRAVATTWLVSFEQIRENDANAADVLGFLSCLEPKMIPESLLSGFNNLTESELIEAIGTLSEFAFVKRQEGSKFLDMHSLVHLAARVWLKESGQAGATIESALEQVYARFPGVRWETRMIQRDYLPHALKITEDDMTKQLNTRYDLIHVVGHSLFEEGRFAESVISAEDTLRWREQHFEVDHFKLLESQYQLGIAYVGNGQVKDAISSLERAIELASKTMAEDDLNRLRCQVRLAEAYNRNGQTKDAIQMLERVVEIQSSKLAEDDVDRLMAQYELANAYLDNGQIKEAIRLLEQIVEIMSRNLAEDHPLRLGAQHSLATAYGKEGQVKDAIRLLERIVEIESRILVEDHPDRLASQHELAKACRKQGRVKDAIRLLERIVELESKTLPEDSSDRLISQYELAVAYLENGEAERAIALFEHVVAIGRRTLADDHPDRLWSEEALSIAREQLQRSQYSAPKKSVVGFPWRRREGK